MSSLEILEQNIYDQEQTVVWYDKEISDHIRKRIFGYPLDTLKLKRRQAQSLLDHLEARMLEQLGAQE